jgi:hypothetical protein
MVDQVGLFPMWTIPCPDADVAVRCGLGLGFGRPVGRDTWQVGIATLREAMVVESKESRIVDKVRFVFDLKTLADAGKRVS